MNKRQVIILWLIAAALGVAVAAVKIGQRGATASATQRAPGDTLLADFPARDVAAIEIRGADESTSLALADGAWTVADRDGYPANTSAVNELLRNLTEIKVAQGIEAGPSFASHFGMDPEAPAAEDRGVTATFRNAAGAELATVSFGKNITGAAPASPFGGGAAGRFIRNHADESGFYAVNELFPTLSTDPKRWLQDGFIRIEKIKSVSVTEPNGEQPAWTVTRDDENADFSLASSIGEEAADSDATAPLKNLFSFSRFDDVIPAAMTGERVHNAEERTATITTFEGFTYTLRFAPLQQAEPEEDEDGMSMPTPENYALTVEVAADLPAERNKAEGETEDDAAAKDAAFASRRAELAERLAKEQKLAGRTFEVGKFTIEALLKPRSELVAPAGEVPNAAAPELPANAAFPTQPPVTATTRPIEAVTPPIAIPPLEIPAGDEDGAPADEETPVEPADEEEGAE
jgi:hypothetical protein